MSMLNGVGPSPCPENQRQIIGAKKKAPDQSCNSVGGDDPNPYKEVKTEMKLTSAKRLATGPDNEELASSGARSVLVPCDEPDCAYVNHGHWADREEPLFMHQYVAVGDPKFRVAIGRLSCAEMWELSVEGRDEDMTPDDARRFARTLTICADITDTLNADRTVTD